MQKLDTQLEERADELDNQNIEMEEDVGMTSQLLLKMEQNRIEKIEREKQEKAEQMENIRRLMNDEDLMTKKEPKKTSDSGGWSKQDLFNAQQH